VTEGAQNSEQGQDPLGGVTDQVGQVTQGVQDTAGQPARQKAEELGMDLSQVEGSGAEGRIIVKDVTSAANRA
jgi:pyruvate/2-oxoglutarate dehydrogenase complex dihydrolipoamide acyltransferase (E2) component